MLFELGCCSPAVDCTEVLATLPKPHIILNACSNYGRGCGRKKLRTKVSFYFFSNFWCSWPHCLLFSTLVGKVNFKFNFVDDFSMHFFFCFAKKKKNRLTDGEQGWVMMRTLHFSKHVAFLPNTETHFNWKWLCFPWNLQGCKQVPCKRTLNVTKTAGTDHSEWEELNDCDKWG